MLAGVFRRGVLQDSEGSFTYRTVRLRFWRVRLVLEFDWRVLP